MKVKDFIKMLQDADPSGESYINMSGGVPIFADNMPGYYDGHYSYIDSENNWIVTTENSKVTLYSRDKYDQVEYLFDRGLSLEQVIEKFIFKGVRNEIKEYYIKEITNTYNMFCDVESYLKDNMMNSLIEQYSKGLRIYRTINKIGEKHDYYSYDFKQLTKNIKEGYKEIFNGEYAKYFNFVYDISMGYNLGYFELKETKYKIDDLVYFEDKADYGIVRDVPVYNKVKIIGITYKDNKRLYICNLIDGDIKFFFKEEELITF